jgi:hypothetical protein
MLATASLAFRQAGPELMASLIQALRTFPQAPYGRSAHATRRAEQALSFEVTDDSLTLLGPQQVQALITGRGPTTTSTASDPRLHEALAQWAEAKGLALCEGQTYEDATATRDAAKAGEAIEDQKPAHRTRRAGPECGA